MAKLNYEIHLDIVFINKMIKATEEAVFLQIFDEFEDLEITLNVSDISWQE